MNRDIYSNKKFTELKERINREIKRRGTFRWNDPMTKPSVGEDKSSPLTIPAIGDRILVDDKTYTINNSSEGSLERTKNIHYPAQGENPAGQAPEKHSSSPNTSAAKFDADEIRNMLIGLAKMNDINLFYGRDETENTAFRDIKGIEDALIAAENAILNKPLHESDCSPTKVDPLTNTNITYPMEDGKYVMPSGEFDGEEIKDYEGLGPNNFYDDYGAKPGDSNFHPYNRNMSELVNRDWHDQDNDRNDVTTIRKEGGIPSRRFGPNPRNPQQGNEYRSRPVYGGVVTNCNNSCTGLCYLTCDNQCSESCSSTCWSRCGNACTASCGNVCTGCSTLCFSSCKTKCENQTGYSCVTAGARTIKITATGGKDGVPARNNIKTTTYSCTGCSYSCQFYPNKKTECWDSGCMGKCFTSCTTSCSTSCYGGCVDNDPQYGSSYKTGKGRGCDAGCTLNCIGLCQGVCEGYCVHTCWHSCKQKCVDNCSWKCTTNCGNGCADTCRQGCAGTSTSQEGCNGLCHSDCTSSCISAGCKAMCGTESANACDTNCRMNCSKLSCTSMCSNACSEQCTTCVNTCGWQCGACVSACSTGCTKECNITCSATCEHSCESNCVNSCKDNCGGCSELCYSCVGMCIGICSLKCESGCSSCTNNCGYWCDSTCNQACFSSCDNMCIQTCVGSCVSFLESNTTLTSGPDRDPTSQGYIYPHPSNRWQERESFRLTRDIPKPVPKPSKKDTALIVITINDERNLNISCPKGLEYKIKQTTIDGGVYTIGNDGNIIIDENMLPGIVEVNKPNLDGSGATYIILFKKNPDIPFEEDDIYSELPFGFERRKLIKNIDGNDLVIIQRDEFLYPREEE